MAFKFNPFTGTLDYVVDNSEFVPYTGATDDVDLGNHTLTCGGTAAGMSTIDAGLTINDGAGGADYCDFRVETASYPEAFLIDASEDTAKFDALLQLNFVPASTDNTVLCLASDGTVISDEIDSRVWGTSIVDYTGTPADNQIAVFTDSNTIEGDSDFTWTQSVFTVNNGSVLFSGTTGDTPTSGGGTRMMWIPSKAAFRAGTATSTYWDAANIGDKSFAVGYNTRAIGEGSACFGYTNYVTGDYAACFGYLNSVISNYGVSFGRNNSVSASDGVCVGYNNEVTGTSAFCGGANSDAAGTYSFVCGYGCSADGNAAVSLGNTNSASGNNSFASGTQCTSSGEYAVCQGLSSTASGYASYAAGNSVEAQASYSRAVGWRSISRQDGHSAIAVGRFNDKGDAQYIKTVLRGNAAGTGTAVLENPEVYVIPDDTTVLIHVYFNIRADDGTSACAVRRVLADYDGTTMTMQTVQTIGTDIDPDGMIDEVLIDDGGSGEINMEVTDAYGDDFAVVAKLEIIENAYYKPAT